MENNRGFNEEQTIAKAQPGKGKRRTFGALRHHNFRLYLFGLVVSLMGTYVQQVAEGWLVYQLTNSAFTLGLVGFVAMVPSVPWMLVAGAIADRMSRRTLLAVVQVGQVFPPLLLAVLTWSGLVQVWHVIVVNVVMGLLSTIDQPTRQALVVEMVAPEDVDNALALTASGFNMARVIGPAMAGILISTVGLAGAFALNGISFLAVFMALIFVQIPQQTRLAQQATLRANLSEGIRYLLGERTIVVLILLMLIVSFFILPYQVLLPVFARDVLNSGAVGLGFLTTVTGIGAILGTAVIVGSSPRRQGVLIAIFALAIPIFTLGFTLANDLLLACLMLALVSGGVVALKTLSFTQIQLQTRDEIRGRVTSILLLMVGATPRIGGLIAGYVAGQVGAPLTLGLGALIAFGSTLAAIVTFAPRLRTTA